MGWVLPVIKDQLCPCKVLEPWKAKASQLVQVLAPW